MRRKFLRPSWQDALQAEPEIAKEQQQETKDILLAAAAQVPDPEQRQSVS
jgi:hypothetical protein